MTQFNDREKAQENKYAHDKEREFKIVARRNKLLGLWAAEKLGLPADERDAYAKSVVMADFERAGDDDVLEKVQRDLEAAQLPSGTKEIREEMHRLLGEARAQLAAE